MELNWVILGWLIDMTLNGFVWLIIAAVSLLLIDVSDKWTRKAVKWMDKAAPIIVHRISFQSKTPLPGVKIVINSLAINPDMEIPADQ